MTAELIAIASSPVKLFDPHPQETMPPSHSLAPSGLRCDVKGASIDNRLSAIEVQPKQMTPPPSGQPVARSSPVGKEDETRMDPSAATTSRPYSLYATKATTTPSREPSPDDAGSRASDPHTAVNSSDDEQSVDDDSVPDTHKRKWSSSSDENDRKRIRKSSPDIPYDAERHGAIQPEDQSTTLACVGSGFGSTPESPIHIDEDAGQDPGRSASSGARPGGPSAPNASGVDIRWNGSGYLSEEAESTPASNGVEGSHGV